MKRKTPAGKKNVTKQAAEAGVPFDQVRALIDLLEERGLEEFEYEKAGVRIRIKRRGSTPAPVFENYGPVGGNPVAGDARARGTAAAGAEHGPGTEDLHVISSPIVGTFYSSPRPDAPPFIKLGDTVEVGQVLCIVEAMKLMNEIESDVDGVVVEIYPKNGQPVEYGEPLFAIKTD